MGSLPNLVDLDRLPDLLAPVPGRPNVLNYIRSRGPRREGNNAAGGQLPRPVRPARSLGNYSNQVLAQDRVDVVAREGGDGPSRAANPRNANPRNANPRNANPGSSNPGHISEKEGPKKTSNFVTACLHQLISIVLSAVSGAGPFCSRSFLFRNFAALCLSNSMVSASLIPLFILQGALSVWWWQSEFSFMSDVFRPLTNIGSLFLSGLFLTGAFSILFSDFLVSKLGINLSLMLSYIAACFFFLMHFFPKVYTLLPAYIFMGIWLGPLTIARNNCLMTLAKKLSCIINEDHDSRNELTQGKVKLKTEVAVFQLARGLQFSHDLGLIIGNIITSLLIWYGSNGLEDITNANIVLDSMFPHEANGDRICGSKTCPNTFAEVLTFKNDSSFDEDDTHEISIMSCKITYLLLSVFLGFCLMAVAVTVGLMDKIKTGTFVNRSNRSAFYTSWSLVRNAFKDYRLLLAAPLSFFIGIEQGFMYSDFTKSYIACTLGIADITTIFVTLGGLHFIAAFTLNLVLQHIGKYPIIAAGMIFQSCLLLVLFVWTPSRDDPAILFVVPATWGVCNAIWDTLIFSFLVSVYLQKWQAPYAHSQFFRFLGLSFFFGIQGFLCNWIKLYILVVFLVLAVVSFTFLEKCLIRARNRLNSQESSF